MTAPVTTDAWRPYWRPLAAVFGLAGFVVGGRAVCLFAQGCRWLVPLDVEGMRAATAAAGPRTARCPVAQPAARPSAPAPSPPA